MVSPFAFRLSPACINGHRKKLMLWLSLCVVPALSLSLGSSTVPSRSLPPSTSPEKVASWAAAFSNCQLETSDVLLPSVAPEDFPKGIYLRNGHARFTSDDGVTVRHMFDGDGMISKLSFDGKGAVSFSNSFIRTRGFLKDRETRTMSMRGVFGTPRSGGILANAGRMSFKNVANTNIVYHGHRLWALWEAGFPFEIDPSTLATISPPEGTDLDGLLTKASPEFSAHPRFDSATGQLLNFGVTLNPLDSTTTVRLFELDSDFKHKREDIISFTLNGACLCHDFVATENYFVFVIAPAAVDSVAGLKALLGVGAFASCVDFTGENSKIVLVPRFKDLTLGTATSMPLDDPRIKVIDAGRSQFNFHFSNAYEKEGKIIFEAVETRGAVELGLNMGDDETPLWSAVDWSKIKPTVLMRYLLDLESETVESTQELTARSPEFPSINRAFSCKPHSFVYCVGSKDERFDTGTPFSSVMKIDTERGVIADHEVPNLETPGECVVVPKVGVSSNEDAVYLVFMSTDGKNKESFFNILDGEDDLRLVYREKLPTFIPHGLHGTFVPNIL